MVPRSLKTEQSLSARQITDHKTQLLHVSIKSLTIFFCVCHALKRHNITNQRVDFIARIRGPYIFALEIHAFEISFHTFLYALNKPCLSKVVIFCEQKQT